MLDNETEIIEPIEDNKKLGKFESDEQLLKAYNQLEKEFTRKSQLLSEYEKEKINKTTTDIDGTISCKTPSYTKADWQSQVDNFLKQNPEAANFAQDIANTIVDNPNIAMSSNSLELAYMNVLKGKYQNPTELVNDKNFLENYIFNNKEIQNMVYKKYLQQAENQAISPSISGKGGNLFLTPPFKPKTFSEAAEIATKYFKK